MHSFFWLYLTINAPDFRLILRDRNTYLFSLIIFFFPFLSFQVIGSRGPVEVKPALMLGKESAIIGVTVRGGDKGMVGFIQYSSSLPLYSPLFR